MLDNPSLSVRLVVGLRVVRPVVGDARMLDPLSARASDAGIVLPPVLVPDEFRRELFFGRFVAVVADAGAVRSLLEVGILVLLPRPL